MNWISVKDRLPKDDFPGHEPSPDVLVNHSCGIEVGRQFGCGVWVNDCLETIIGVTHWMPIPKPPGNDVR